MTFPTPWGPVTPMPWHCIAAAVAAKTKARSKGLVDGCRGPKSLKNEHILMRSTYVNGCEDSQNAIFIICLDGSNDDLGWCDLVNSPLIVDTCEKIHIIGRN